MNTESTLHMIAATIESLNIHELEELIEELGTSKKPDDITTVELAQLIRKVKIRVEKIETNWKLRLQAWQHLKERSGKDETSPNTNKGESIDKQKSEAA